MCCNHPRREGEEEREEGGREEEREERGRGKRRERKEK